MAIKETRGMKLLRMVNVIFLVLAALICIMPLIHILAISFSTNSVVAANMVTFWPVKFTLRSYEFLLKQPPFWNSFLVSIKRVILGGVVNIVLVLLMAYPLSKEKSHFKGRTFYAWYFFFTLLFSGGLIPLYVLINQLHLMGTIWALILPAAVPIFEGILMLNFFRQLPKELEEAALIDGAGHWRILWQIYIPCSVPAIATIGLFIVVGHWNAWFDGLIFSNRPENYPLQSYLQTIIVASDLSKIQSAEDLDALKDLSDRTLKTAQIVISMIPVLAIYPFLQKYFVSGIVLGSVKG